MTDPTRLNEQPKSGYPGFSDTDPTPERRWTWRHFEEASGWFLFAPDGRGQAFVKSIDVSSGARDRILRALNETESLRERVRVLEAALDAAEAALRLVEPEFLSLDAFDAFAAWRALAGAGTQEETNG